MSLLLIFYSGSEDQEIKCKFVFCMREEETEMINKGLPVKLARQGNFFVSQETYISIFTNDIL